LNSLLTPQSKAAAPYNFAGVPEILPIVVDPDSLAGIGDSARIGSARDRMHLLREALKQQRANLQLMVENVRRIDGRLERAEAQISTQLAIVAVCLFIIIIIILLLLL
jgi:hypothetical protein